MLKNVRKRALISCCFPNRVCKLHFDACENLEICPKRSGCVYSELHKYYLNKIPQTSNFEFCVITLEEAHWLKPPTLARHHTTICMSYFMTGGPGKEQGTSKLPPTRRVQERSKGGATCLTTSQNPFGHPSWLNKGAPPGRTLRRMTG